MSIQIGNRLSSQSGFLHVQMFTVHDVTVGGNQISGKQTNPIARHYFAARNVNPTAVAKNCCGRSDTLAQKLYSLLGMIGLKEVDGDAEDDHRNDDRCVYPF